MCSITSQPGGEDEGLCGLGPPELVPALHDDLVARVGRQVAEEVVLNVVSRVVVAAPVAPVQGGGGGRGTLLYNEPQL